MLSLLIDECTSASGMFWALHIMYWLFIFDLLLPLSYLYILVILWYVPKFVIKLVKLCLFYFHFYFLPLSVNKDVQKTIA